MTQTLLISGLANKCRSREAAFGAHLTINLAANSRVSVIDIVRVEDGKYVELWGVNTLLTVLADLRNT